LKGLTPLGADHDQACSKQLVSKTSGISFWRSVCRMEIPISAILPFNCPKGQWSKEFRTERCETNPLRHWMVLSFMANGILRSVGNGCSDDCQHECSQMGAFKGNLCFGKMGESFNVKMKLFRLLSDF
jgi:hypothetical protein